MGKVTTPYEELQLEERKEYWVDYVTRLAAYMQNPNLSDLEVDALYKEVQRIFSVIRVFDSPEGSIPSMDMPSKLNDFKGISIPKRGSKRRLKGKRTFNYTYHSKENKFRKAK